MALPSTAGNSFASAAPGTTVSGTLNGLFKQVFADKLLPLVPEFAILQKLVSFADAEKVGRYYSQPVVVSSEAGFTYLGISGAVSSLNNPLAGQIQEAQVYPSELNLRAQLSYASLTRAAEKGPRAFERESKFKVEDMNGAVRKRLEIAMLYGQSGIGTVSTSTYDGSTYTNVVLTDASWAGGIWAGMEGAMIDSWNGTSRRNGAVTPLVIAKVNASTKTLSFSADQTSNVAAGDVLFFYNSRTGATSYNEMAGLQTILSNTSSSLFNIDASLWSLWQGNSVTSAGNLSLAKLQLWVALAVNRGLMEKVAVFLSPKGWAQLANNEAALRMYDRSYSSKQAENGFEALRFHSQNGLMEIYSHPMVKDGDCFILPVEMLTRIGSVDLTFGRPGVDGEETVYFDRVPGTTALELQAMCDQAIFLPKPSHGVFATGITYPS
jgi:hypothetical protein